MDDLPTERKLREAFKGIPSDPRTGEPIGFVSFAVELEARRAAETRTEERVVHGQRVKVMVCPTRWANGANRQSHGRLSNKQRGC